MKHSCFPELLLAVAGLSLFLHAAPPLAAQTVPPPPSTLAPDQALAPRTEQANFPLSWGVPEILKLVRSQVGDETIVAFIANSGRVYNLSVAEIVYLREQGVSNAVLTAMLNQRSKLADGTLRPAPPQPQAAPMPSSSSDYAQPAPTYTPPAPAPAYSQAAPAYTPTPPTYVVPGATTYVYPSYNYPYYAYPYYGGYYGYSYPAVSLSFGFGGGYWGGYRGGWGHGGWGHGGGFHGGHR